jgi:hypothetical protein
MNDPQTYTLLGADGKPCQSATKGQWAGHRATRIYGRLDCPAALRAIARGGYARYRVFFADEATAIAVGYRPCVQLTDSNLSDPRVDDGHAAGPAATGPAA